MTDRIREAWEYDACTTCGAAKGDPCRTPTWRPTASHAGRPRLQRSEPEPQEKRLAPELCICVDPAPDTYGLCWACNKMVRHFLCGNGGVLRGEKGGR